MTNLRQASELLRSLLPGLVDYAGLFPPAQLGMPDAVARYASYRGREHAWILGRFIVPAVRLDELEAAARDLLPTRVEAAWPLSALVAGPVLESAAERIRAFNHEHCHGGKAGAAEISSVEIAASTEEEISSALKALPPGLEVFFELPASKDPAPFVSLLKGTRARAKIRTGGVTESAFPTAAEVARFVVTCAEARVAFKATAGLHHALRGRFPLTYEPASPKGPMFGFLNVFLAAAFAYTGRLRRAEVEALLVEDSAAAFSFAHDAVTWRGNRLQAEEIARARARFALSYGSCSFEEPIADLQELKLL